MTEVIHKLNITPEATFDLSVCLELPLVNKRTLKAEVEEYITHMTASGCLPWWGYLRVDYVDELSDRRLKLFVYKGIKIGLMQYWDLAGVCEAADWSQDAEDDGLIRSWLKTKTKDLPEEDDWTVLMRANQLLNETKKTKYEKALKEVLDEFDCKRDKELAEKLVLLQGAYFRNGKRRRLKKTNVGN